MLVIPAVADENPLAIFCLSLDARVSLGIRTWPLIGGCREGYGQPATWIRIAKQDCGNAGAALLARVPRFQNRTHFVQPRHGHGSGCIEHYHGMRILRSHSLN